ncbi:MAG: PEPxxWA-CTERM sorting domain-containing protein [Parasphingorhabdus sp.]|uniref:PEPxxWA-CTERM sorting domain-containing protein n=1 Tax=Parasphingorhabdus sp. TaxID=2709688 RepID=UPI003001848F
MLKFKKFVTAGAALLITSQAHAAEFVDQNQPNNPDYMAGFSQTDLAQSFQQSSSNISGAGIFLQSGIGSIDDVTISLWDLLPNAFGASQLATGSVLGTQGSWADVFWTPVAIVAGQTYFLAFGGNTSLGISGDTSNPYANGQTYANPGYGSFPTFDYTFRTFSSDSLGAVPEPSTWAFMIFGFGAIGGAMRRRRNVNVKVSYA